MKFAFATALLAGLAVAAPSPKMARDEKAIEKRLGPFGLAIAGGIVSGIVGAAAKKFLDGSSARKRATQSFQQFQTGFTSSVSEEISKEAKDGEASICVKTGGYHLDDNATTRAKATVELTSDEGAEDFDCFFISGGDFTLDVEDIPDNVAVQAGDCTFADGKLSC